MTQLQELELTNEDANQLYSSLSEYILTLKKYENSNLVNQNWLEERIKTIEKIKKKITVNYKNN
jgi:uncharacterized protein YlxW (UPF0749 family)